MTLIEQIKKIAMKKSINIIENKIENIHKKSSDVVPIDTGYLSTTWFKRTLSLTDEDYMVEFGWGAWYAKFPDLGTVHQRAQGYFTPIVKEEFGVN